MRHFYFLLVFLTGGLFPLSAYAQLQNSCVLLLERAQPPKQEPIISHFENGENPLLTNAGLRNQKNFLEMLGVQILPNALVTLSPAKAVQIYNQMVLDLIRQGKIKENEALFWPDTYVGSDGHLIFVRAGESPPEAATPFTESSFRILSEADGQRTVYTPSTPANADLRPAKGLLSEADYYYGILRGFFPGNFGTFLVGMTGTSKPKSVLEPLFHHDFGHLGGFIAHPRGMAAIRKAAEKYFESTHEEWSHTVSSRLFYANELLGGFREGAQERFLALSSRVGLVPDDFLKKHKIENRFRGLNRETIQLAKRLIQFHEDESLPFGGVLRTAGTHPIYRTALDRLIEDMKKETSRIEIWNLFFGDQRRLQIMVSTYLFLTKAFLETEIEGWFELETNERLQPQGAYHRYLCSNSEYREWSRPSFCF